MLQKLLSHYNLKILRPKVTKNIKNLHKKFCEFPPRAFAFVKAGHKHVDEINPRFSLCDFPLHLPLELLGVNKCLQVRVKIIVGQANVPVADPIKLFFSANNFFFRFSMPGLRF